MKKYILPISFILVFIVPQLLLSRFLNTRNADQKPVVSFTEIPPRATDFSGCLLVKDADEVKQMELDEYVLGVLLGEMPAEFEFEALKAQAVASRTYTMRKVQKQNKHKDAHICTDSSCCQAFVALEDYLNHRGSEADLGKIRRAVTETSGQVLTYNGNLIEATYFSCSGGKTEDAVDVWGADVPYLQSVPSPGEESAAKYSQEQIYTRTQFLMKLGLADSTVLTEQSMLFTYTAGGGVDKLSIDGKSFSGIQLRSLLSLPSTAFSIDISGDNITVITKGNGHRVGMSQYGADAMAVTGSKYDEILAYYYPGTELQIYTAEQMKAVFDKAGNL